MCGIVLATVTSRQQGCSSLTHTKIFRCVAPPACSLCDLVPATVTGRQQGSCSSLSDTIGQRDHCVQSSFLIHLGLFSVCPPLHGVRARCTRPNPSARPLSSPLRANVQLAAEQSVGQVELFLNSVPLLSNLTYEQKVELVDAFVEEHFAGVRVRMRGVGWGGGRAPDGRRVGHP